MQYIANKLSRGRRPAIHKRPEVLDDFIRNVLLKLGMVRCVGMRGRARSAGPMHVAAARCGGRVRATG